MRDRCQKQQITANAIWWNASGNDEEFVCSSICRLKFFASITWAYTVTCSAGNSEMWSHFISSGPKSNCQRNKHLSELVRYWQNEKLKWETALQHVFSSYYKLIIGNCGNKKTSHNNRKRTKLTVMIESSLIDDSNWSSSQRMDTSGAGSAKPVVSNNIWSILQQM